MTWTRVLPAAVLAATLACAPDVPAPAAAPGDGPRSQLAELTVEAEAPEGYDRDLFGEPDREALLATSRADRGCYWSAADELCHRDPEAVHVDHLVALAEAWQSGLDPADAGAFGADLRNVWLMTAELNMAKSDRDPAEWFPPAGDPCVYVSRWVAVKAAWDLSVDPAEADALALTLTDC